MRLCARYLLEARSGAQARDRVEHFHLSNGARVERLNWLADRSAKGIAQSAGLMVNYRYKLDEIDANHEAYTGEGRITAAPGVRALL
jgi:malonyl-CoA decarboxylase